MSKVKGKKKISDLAFYLFLVVMIMLALSFSLDKNPKKSLLGYRIYNVKTPSMEPQIKKGSISIVKVMDPEKLEIGDVIIYALNDQTNLTHRLVEKKVDDKGNKFVVTKGDVNKNNDSPVKYERVIGKVVFHLPYLGYGLMFIQTNLNYFIVGLLAIIAFVATIKYIFKKIDDAEDLKEEKSERKLPSKKKEIIEENNEEVEYILEEDMLDDDEYEYVYEYVDEEGNVLYEEPVIK